MLDLNLSQLLARRQALILPFLMILYLPVMVLIPKTAQSAPVIDETFCNRFNGPSQSSTMQSITYSWGTGVGQQGTAGSWQGAVDAMHTAFQVEAFPFLPELSFTQIFSRGPFSVGFVPVGPDFLETDTGGDFFTYIFGVGAEGLIPVGQTGAVNIVTTCLITVKKPTFTIKLFSTTGTAQEANALADVEPGLVVTGLVAKVHDQNGQLVPNVDVKLEVKVMANSGGHQHDDDARHTKYMGKLISPQGTTTENGKVLTGNTGTFGLPFTFQSPEFPNNPAGDHTITASCTDRTCTQQGPNQVWVGIKFLVSIPNATDITGSAQYVLIGADNHHQNNHYVSSAALAQLDKLTYQYRQEFLNDPPLHLNDSSLERGGVFDIQGSWAPPHAEHRRGFVIDIRANSAPGAIPAKNFRSFQMLLRSLGMSYEFEDPGTPNQHYHVRLLGIKQ